MSPFTHDEMTQKTNHFIINYELVQLFWEKQPSIMIASSLLVSENAQQSKLDPASSKTVS